MLTPAKKHEIICMLAGEPEKYYSYEELLACVFDVYYDRFSTMSDVELEHEFNKYCKRYNLEVL